MPVVESLPALVVLLDILTISSIIRYINNNNRIEHKKRSKGLLFFAICEKKKFDETLTFLSLPKTLLIFSRTLISKRVLTLLLQKRVVVCLLSLSLLSFSFIATLRVVQRYI
jgi:hypothetical protein